MGFKHVGVRNPINGFYVFNINRLFCLTFAIVNNDRSRSEECLNARLPTCMHAGKEN